MTRAASGTNGISAGGLVNSPPKFAACGEPAASAIAFCLPGALVRSVAGMFEPGLLNTRNDGLL